MISVARQEFRRAFGVPLTVDEIEQHRRENELEDLRAFVYSKFFASASYALNEELTWHDDRVVVEYTSTNISFAFSAFSFIGWDADMSIWRVEDGVMVGETPSAKRTVGIRLKDLSVFPAPLLFGEIMPLEVDLQRTPVFLLSRNLVAAFKNENPHFRRSEAFGKLSSACTCTAHYCLLWPSSLLASS